MFFLKKQFFLIIILSLVLFLPLPALGLFTANWTIENVTIRPSNVIEVGQEVIISFEVYGSSLAVLLNHSVEPIVNFGDGIIEHDLSECKAEGPPYDKEKRCSYSLSHTYDTPGEYTIYIDLPTAGALFSIPLTVATPSQPAPSTPGGNPLVATSIDSLIRFTANFIYWLGTGIALIVLALGGFLFLTSGGDPRNISRARNTIFYSLLGFAIMSLARGIIQLVLVLIGSD